MLKYTTYQSIYDQPSRRSTASRKSEVSGWSRGLIKITFLLVLLMVTGTSVVTAFASDAEKSKQAEHTTVIVKPGDTLWEIAVNHKPRGKDTRVYIEAIKRFNGLTISSIQAGDTLIMPD